MFSTNEVLFISFQTIVMVIDKGEGFNRKNIPTNIINLNLGKNVEYALPTQFWSRLTNKLGEKRSYTFPYRV